MEEIKIRFMDKDDDVDIVSSLLLEADEQTYPPLWGSKEDQIKAFSYLINNMPLFSRKKIIVATYHNQIVGALLFFINGEQFDVEIGKKTFTNFNKEVPSAYMDTVKGYFIPTTQFNSKFYILNIAINKSMRRKGIASKLLTYFINYADKEDISLEVITENVNALRLYEDFSFRAYEEFQTFCLYSNRYRSLYMLRKGR